MPKNLIELGWPQLYLAIYFGQDRIYYFNNEPHIYLKVGSTTKSISERIRSEAGQLSHIRLLELVGLCIYNKPIDNSILKRIEDNVRFQVKTQYESTYPNCGYLSQENYLIPLSKLEKFIKIFKDSTNNIISSYNLFSEALEIISYDDPRKVFVNKTCLEITKLYKEYYDLFCMDRDSAANSLQVIHEYITENCPGRSEIYVKQEIDKTRIQKKKTADSLPAELGINDLKRLGSHLNKFQRKGKDSVIIKSPTIQKIIGQTIQNRSKNRKNREWSFKTFGKNVGDIIWFYCKNAGKKAKCVICEGDTIQPLQYFFDKEETQTKYAKATYINLIEGKIGKQIRNIKGRNATQDWKLYFFEDENCTTSFKSLQNNILNNEHKKKRTPHLRGSN